MAWFTSYRHEIKRQPEGWVVNIWQTAQHPSQWDDGFIEDRLIQQLPFETCNAALSFVEKREGCQSSSFDR